uniref:Uncharacterized protein n=1 Tax=Oryza sativa subsp. japonica TaxID=39947 RepID=Q2QVT6_ORYSJ|nr:hypothetical protein LOC_Os12g11700 [Oryza sativa Japonica Group]
MEQQAHTASTRDLYARHRDQDFAHAVVECNRVVVDASTTIQHLGTGIAGFVRHSPPRLPQLTRVSSSMCRLCSIRDDIGRSLLAGVTVSVLVSCVGLALCAVLAGCRDFVTGSQHVTAGSTKPWTLPGHRRSTGGLPPCTSTSATSTSRIPQRTSLVPHSWEFSHP